MFSTAEAGSDEADSAGASVSRTYRLIPVSDHPIFPGSSTSLSITKEQYKIIKEHDTVFASVVKNDKVLAKPKGDLRSELENETGAVSHLGLPKITHESDIYSVGTLCHAKAIYDANNPFSPYLLNILAMKRGKLDTWLDPVEALARVFVDESFNPAEVTEDDLDTPEKVLREFMKKQLEKLFVLAPEERFIAYL